MAAQTVEQGYVCLRRNSSQCDVYRTIQKGIITSSSEVIIKPLVSTVSFLEGAEELKFVQFCSS